MIDRYFKDRASKPFVRFLKNWFQGKDFSRIVIAKNLSSMITHSLIEAEFKGIGVLEDLDLNSQLENLQEFIRGDIDEPKLKELYSQRYNSYL